MSYVKNYEYGQDEESETEEAPEEVEETEDQE